MLTYTLFKDYKLAESFAHCKYVYGYSKYKKRKYGEPKPEPYHTSDGSANWIVWTH